eukprot:552332-Pyramimonas_sp.AAC.1
MEWSWGAVCRGGGPCSRRSTGGAHWPSLASAGEEAGLCRLGRGHRARGAAGHSAAPDRTP